MHDSWLELWSSTVEIFIKENAPKIVKHPENTCVNHNEQVGFYILLVYSYNSYVASYNLIEVSFNPRNDSYNFLCIS